MKKTYLVIAVLVAASVAIGLFGITKGAPKAETAILQGLMEQNQAQGFVLPMQEAFLGIWWGIISIIIGLFLVYGFFWDLPWWPEKAVLVPALGFIALNVGFSLYMLWGIVNVIQTPEDVMAYVRGGTMPMYASVVGWMVVGVLGRYLWNDSGDVEW